MLETTTSSFGIACPTFFGSRRRRDRRLFDGPWFSVVREYPMKKFPVKGLKEVLGPDDKLYGYLIIWNNKYVSAGAKLAEDKTMQVYPYYVPVGGP